MTCVIGLHYDSGKGAIVISDSRVMTGGDYFSERKVFEVAEGVVFASSGYSGMAEKLLRGVKTTRIRSRQFLPEEIVNIFEDEMADIYSRYKMTRPYRFTSDDVLLNGIIGVVEESCPKLYCLYENGFAETIGQFQAVGHGARHAHNILRSLYDAAMPKERALEIGVHALIEVAKVDAMVDNMPQIAVLETITAGDKIKPVVTFLNHDKDEKFEIESATIQGIKQKVEGIETKRTKVFHLLLDGSSDLRKKLDGVLHEYEDTKRTDQK